VRVNGKLRSEFFARSGGNEEEKKRTWL